MQDQENILLSDELSAEATVDIDNTSSADIITEDEVKPKRTRRKKTDDTLSEDYQATESTDESKKTESEDTPHEDNTENTISAELLGEVLDDSEGKTVDELLSEDDAPTAEAIRTTNVERPRKNAPILTIEAGGDFVTEEMQADIAWHEIHNAYRTRRILSGVFGGLEQLDSGKYVGIVEYRGYRILIPMKEMIYNYPNQLQGPEYKEEMQRLHRNLSNMLGAEIDFMVKGIDSKARSVVASRKDAMRRKRQIFYIDEDMNGERRVREGRLVQARIIGVHEKILRLEIFGVETTILARNLSWEWIGDVHDHYSVGDHVIVRITNVEVNDIDNIRVKTAVRSDINSARDNLKLCKIQGKYSGTVIDVHKGVCFIRLNNGVNAVAHSCRDRRYPGKKDEVSFTVTSIDEERNTAVGIITRIIKQNL